MKVTGRALSILMSIVLVVGLMPLPAFAETGSLAPAQGDVLQTLGVGDDEYGDDEFVAGDEPGEGDENETVYVTKGDLGSLQSTHPYADDLDKTWVYADESATYGMAVTFSDDTETESYCDEIIIYNDSGVVVGDSSGTGLAGRTVYIPNSTSFKIRLTSDSSVTYYGFRVTDVRALAEGEELPSIAFEPAQPYQFIEGCQGYWESSDSEDTFRYSVPGFVDGDQLTVTADGATRVFVYGEHPGVCEDDWCFLSDEGDVIMDREIELLANSYLEYWDIGLHEMTVRFDGMVCSVPVEVVANPVSYVEFIHAGAYRIVEEDERFGYWDDYWDGDEDGNEVTRSYFCYSWPSFEDGDVLRVTGSNGFIKDYTYTSVVYGETMIFGPAFVASDGSVINMDSVERSSSQYGDDGRPGWGVGSHEFLLSYFGRTCAVDAEIVARGEGSGDVGLDDSSDDTVVYVTAPDFLRLQSAHDYADDLDKTWVYADESAAYGMAVTFSDDTETEEDYDVVTIYDGGDNVVGTYSGRDLAGRTVYIPNSASFKIRLTSNGSETRYGFRVTDVRALAEGEEIPGDPEEPDNPDDPDDPDDPDEATVQSISFEPAEPYVLVEERDGWWADEDEDGVDDFFEYSWSGFKEGDCLTVVELDGNEVVYTCHFDDDLFDWVFYADGRDPLPSYYINLSDDQWSNHWGIEDDHLLTVSYGGCSCTVPVSVVPNPVASISFEPAGGDRYTLMEEVDGSWCGTYEDGELVETDFIYSVPEFRAGDRLVVTAAENSAETVYTYDEDSWTHENGEWVQGVFWSEDGESLSESRPSIRFAGNDFSVGMHDMIVSYFGRVCTVPVEIVANPVERIVYQTATPFQLIEGFDGGWAEVEDENGEIDEFYCYSETLWRRAGDTVTVIGTDGSEDVYRCSCDEESGEWGFFSDSGEMLENVGMSFADDQYDHHWQVGETHDLTVSYLGRWCTVPVEIVENPVKEISLEPASPYRFREHDEESGWWTCFEDEDGEYVDYFEYGLWFAEGDRLLVTSNDGAVTAYAYGYLDDGEAAFVAADGSTIGLDMVSMFADQESERGWGLGEHEATVSYLSRFCSVPVEIVEGIDLSDATVTIPSQTYTGRVLFPQVTVKLANGTLVPEDGYCVDLDGCVNAGSYEVTVRGRGVYSGEVGGLFEVKPASIKNATLVLSDTELIYNKKPQKPTVTTVGGKKLKAGIDYTLKYSNAKSTKVGSYTVQVTGKGNYTGTSAKATYKILNANPVKVTAKKPTVSLAKVKKAKQVVAAKNAYSVTGNKGGKVTYKKASGDKAITVASNGNVTVAKGAKKGVHTVKVTASFAAKGNYASASKTVTLKVTVK